MATKKQTKKQRLDELAVQLEHVATAVHVITREKRSVDRITHHEIRTARQRLSLLATKLGITLIPKEIEL